MASALEIPVVLEPAKKKPLKEKRKRKKSADKDNKDPIRMDTYRNSVQTTIYSTLPLYEEMKSGHSLEDSDLYVEFNRYILTPEQLTKNDFPLECPENPGQIISRCKKFRQDPTSRVCSRCYQTFHIKKDKYISETNCFYHTARCDVGHFKCCDTSYGSKGCTLSLYHVSSELALDNVVFKRVEGKRQVREDQSYKVYALDCEMVFTTIGMEVTKVGLVDLEGKTIYQTFVLPEHPILDYNTKFSGITANDLKGISITLADVQSFLLRTLNKDTILVGHALQNDLRVLRLIHEKVVDTQVVFHEGNYRRKLKALAHEYLKKSIQDSKTGHDSIEDARACMELMLWKIKSDLDKRPPMRKKQSFPQNCLKNVCPLRNKKFQPPKDLFPSEIRPMAIPLSLTLDYNIEQKKPKDLSKIQPMPIPLSLRLDYTIEQKNFCLKCGCEKSALGQTRNGGMTLVCPWCFYNILS